MKKIGAEAILVGITLGISFWVWVTASIYSISAKADRVIAVEEKLDYIYKYVLEHDKK